MVMSLFVHHSFVSRPYTRVTEKNRGPQQMSGFLPMPSNRFCTYDPELCSARITAFRRCPRSRLRDYRQQ